MFCGNCGHGVPDGASFCGGCGQPIATESLDEDTVVRIPPTPSATVDEPQWYPDDRYDADDDEPQPSVDNEWEHEDRGPPRGRRWLLPALVVIAALTAGAAAYAVSSRDRGPAQVASDATRPSTTTTGLTSTTVPIATEAMPAVVGLSLEAARSLLDRAGVAFDVEERESIQPAGTVMDQTPAAGAAKPARARLVVARRGDPLSASSRLRLNGFGGVEVGMTVAEAEQAAGRRLASDGEDFNGCSYVTPVGLDGVSFMVIENEIRRIDIHRGSFATQSGVRIGATEAEVRSTYAGQIETQPHPYDETGHYLVYRPRDATQRQFLLIFETDGNRVESFRAGERTAVEAVEGCV